MEIHNCQPIGVKPARVQEPAKGPVCPATPEAPEAPHSASDSSKLSTGANASARACLDFLDQGQAPKVFYLNGIRTPEASARKTSEQLESRLGQKVELLYNPTEGLIGDACETLANLSGLDTRVSGLAQERFRHSLDQGEKIRIFAHSQGAAIAADALRKLAKAYQAEGLSPAELKQ
ncbi:MAG TPA: hypothetical protein V6D23_11945, partial [Candidatus Obscuribacterales bacterium]